MLPFLLPWAAPAAAVAAPEQLPPSSAWNVDYAENSCILRRIFGTAEKPVILRFERFAPGDGFQLLLVGKALGRFSPNREVLIAFGAEESREAGRVFFAETSDNTPSLLFVGATLKPLPEQQTPPEAGPPVVQISPEDEKAVASVSITQKGRDAVVLRTGSLGRPFEAFRACTDQLLESWGLDPEQQKTLSRRPIPNDPGRWVGPADYPTNALTTGKQAMVTFLLLIDEKGRSTECRIPAAYADEAFKRRTCFSIMKNAKFQPALDAERNSVPSYYVNRVSWLIP